MNYRLIRYRIKKRNIHIGRLMPVKGNMAWEIQILGWIIMFYHKKGREMVVDHGGHYNTIGIGPLRFWGDKYWNAYHMDKRHLYRILVAVLVVILVANLAILANIIASDTVWCIENYADVPHCLIHENNIFGRFIHPSLQEMNDVKSW